MAHIDLHMHSIYSDGDQSIEQLYKLIKEKKIHTFALTDHDVLNGTKEMTKVILEDNDPSILFIPGIELTAKVPHGRMHLLGYDYDLENHELNRVLREKKEDDIYNFLLQLDRLTKDYNIVFSNEDVDAILNRVGNIGRVDLAKLLIKYGYCTNVAEAFQKYLNPVMESIRKQKKGLLMEDCVKLIVEAGGIVSWAHFNSYAKTKQELYDTAKYLVSLGMRSIESEHINLNSEERLLAKYVAQEFGLLESGGTDYHGQSIKPNVELGTGINGNIDIDSISIVDEIKVRRLKKDN